MSASTSSNATVQAADTSYADYKASNFEMDPTISEEERRFYLKAYPSIDLVRERKVHCTVCKQHIGTAPIAESNIKMHPVLRVTHCVKCHDFYNSGEFSKGEDGSELYCRWCGQGGEVYCCSNCPYVFCKSCIVKNLSRGVVADIEQNENWSCFNCAPKILWPLRAQHWALINYIDVQKKYVESLKLPENEARAHLFKDLSHCCRLAKAKCGNMSDSLESLESANSRRSLASGTPAKKSVKVSISPGGQTSAAKRPKTSNDEVVCTPDLLSMLEPDCQLTVKPRTPMSSPITSAPKIMTVQTNYNHPAPLTAPRSSVPPPLVLRNTSIKIRPIAASSPILRRTVIGQRGPSPVGNTTPVYHTINGYRIDLNSAAQQETFRLPNGKLIQVKRQGTAGNTNASPSPSQQQMQQAPSQITGTNHWPQRLNVSVQQGMRNLTCISGPQAGYNAGNYSVQQQQQQQHQQQQQQQQQTQQIPIQHPPAIRYHNTTVRPVGNAINTPNVATAPQPMQMINGTPAQAPNIRPAMVRHVFATTAIGQARTQLQDQIFNAMEICQHLTGKVQTLTNSNAYKQARNYLEVKELYIHLSYLITYAIGRFKGLQDKCLGDMRQLGFVNDADSLENGQLAADKQASDDEDNEIEIVEPKTDTITLDSDNDDDVPIIITTSKPDTPETTPTQISTTIFPTTTTTTAATATASTTIDITSQNDVMNTLNVSDTDHNEFTAAALLSFLDLDMPADSEQTTRTQTSSPSDATQKKQPRKKTTNKPNPTLLQLERVRLEEMKTNDTKLKMNCAVKLKRAEIEFPYTKILLNDQNRSNNKMIDKTKMPAAAENKELQASSNENNENGLVGKNTTDLKAAAKDDENQTDNEDEITLMEIDTDSDDEAVAKLLKRNVKDVETVVSSDAANKKKNESDKQIDCELNENDTIELLTVAADKANKGDKAHLKDNNEIVTDDRVKTKQSIKTFTNDRAVTKDEEKIPEELINTKKTTDNEVDMENDVKQQSVSVHNNKNVKENSIQEDIIDTTTMEKLIVSDEDTSQDIEAAASLNEEGNKKMDAAANKKIIEDIDMLDASEQQNDNVTLDAQKEDEKTDTTNIETIEDIAMLDATDANDDDKLPVQEASESVKIDTEDLQNIVTGIDDFEQSEQLPLPTLVENIDGIDDDVLESTVEELMAEKDNSTLRDIASSAIDLLSDLNELIQNESNSNNTNTN